MGASMTAGINVLGMAYVYYFIFLLIVNIEMMLHTMKEAKKRHISFTKAWYEVEIGLKDESRFFIWFMSICYFVPSAIAFTCSKAQN